MLIVLIFVKEKKSLVYYLLATLTFFIINDQEVKRKSQMFMLSLFSTQFSVDLCKM